MATFELWSIINEATVANLPHAHKATAFHYKKNNNKHSLIMTQQRLGYMYFVNQLILYSLLLVIDELRYLYDGNEWTGTANELHMSGQGRVINY